MLLIGFTEEPGWIRSTFNLTYRVPWEGLLKGVRGVYPYIEDAEVQVDGDPLHFSAPEDLLAIPEASSIMIRGMSPILKAPIMLTLAVSMGGSNEFVECFCWGAVVEGGSGAVVELVGDGVEVWLVAGDGGSFG